MTIYAGDTYAETSASFFQTGPTSDATIGGSISLSPSTLTSAGVTFSTSCIGSTADILNLVGQFHNDYQDSLFSYIVNNNIDISDTSALKTIIQTKHSAFSTGHGLGSSTAAITWWNDPTSIGYDPNDYSYDAASILSSLNSLAVNLNSSNESGFVSSAYSLLASALQLPDINEVYTVGIAIAVAINSYNYWTENAITWGDLIYDQIDNRTAYSPPLIQNQDILSSSAMTTINDNTLIDRGTSTFNNTILSPLSTNSPNFTGRDAKFFVKFQPKKNKIIMADIEGAIVGARVGTLFGPGGALSVGLMSAAAASACNVLNQIMDDKYSWWPW